MTTKVKENKNTNVKDEEVVDGEIVGETEAKKENIIKTWIGNGKAWFAENKKKLAKDVALIGGTAVVVETIHYFLNKDSDNDEVAYEDQTYLTYTEPTSIDDTTVEADETTTEA